MIYFPPTMTIIISINQELILIHVELTKIKYSSIVWHLSQLSLAHEPSHFHRFEFYLKDWAWDPLSHTDKHNKITFTIRQQKWVKNLVKVSDLEFQRFLRIFPGIHYLPFKCYRIMYWPFLEIRKICPWSLKAPNSKKMESYMKYEGHYNWPWKVLRW